jgi:hypothetical protein
MERKFDIFAVIGMRMGWLSRRRKVVAGNIANADAPNYRDGEAPSLSRSPPHADLGGGPKNGRGIRRAKSAGPAAFRIRAVAGDYSVPAIENPSARARCPAVPSARGRMPGTAPARVA